MRIMIFMCGEGLGHTSRCLALGKELLAAGHEIEFGAYGYSNPLSAVFFVYSLFFLLSIFVLT